MDGLSLLQTQPVTNPTHTGHLTPLSSSDFCPLGYPDGSFSRDLMVGRQGYMMGSASYGLQVDGGMECSPPSVCPERQRQGCGALAAIAYLLSPSYCLPGIVLMALHI